MDLQEVESSNVKYVGWDNDELTVVYLSGNSYVFENVPKSVYDGLLQAKSVGRYVNEFVKNKYTFHRG